MKALQLVREQVAKVENEMCTQTLLEPCTGYTRTALGLPCAHERELRDCVVRLQPLSPGSVYAFWHLRRAGPPAPLQIRDPAPLPTRARERPGMQRELLAVVRVLGRPRRCGNCAREGHDRRTYEQENR